MADIEKRESFRLGDWTVEPQLNRLSRDGRHVEVEPKSIAVLAYMAARPGQVISSDEFIDVVWHGRPMGDNPVHRCVSRLRQALGDDARHPRYIATVQRKGYRLIAEVKPLTDSGKHAPVHGAGTKIARYRSAIVAGAVVLVLSIGGAVLLRTEQAMPSPSIAVLPFADLVDNTGFGDVISAEIRSDLGRVEGLDVASRTASDVLGGQDPKIIGDKLGVSWVLEGTVHIDSANFRVTAQLIDAATRLEAWSDAFEATTIFSMPNQIVVEVVRTIGSLSPGILRARGTDVIGAYDEFLRGQAALDRPHNDENLNEAVQHYTKALKSDGNYARAHAGLCRSYVAWFGFSHAADYVGKAEEACAAARSLDPSLSEVPLALGELYRSQGLPDVAEESFRSALQLNANSSDALTGLAQTFADRGDTTSAEDAFKAALEAQPNDWTGYTRYGYFLFARGRYAESARMYQRAVDLQTPHTAPFSNLGAALYLMGDFEMAAKAFEESLNVRPNRSAHSNLGTMYYYLGQYDKAADQYRHGIDLQPQDYVMWGNLGDALSRSSNPDDDAKSAYEQAIELAKRNLDVNPNNGETRAMLGSYQAHIGMLEEAESTIARAIADAPDTPYVHYYAAVVYAIAARPEAAMPALEKAVELGYPVVLVTVDPEFVPLRGSASYEALTAGTRPASY